MLNKTKYLIEVIVVIILVFIVIIAYKNIEPSVTENDIMIEATLRLNDTDNIVYKEYLLDTNITKNKNCNVIIYPYIEDIGAITYNKKEGDGYVILDSIGSDGITDAIALKEIKNTNLVNAGDDISLVGFWVPEEVGQYKVRTYFGKLDNFQEIINPVLVCVFREEKFGKELTWSKLIPITIK
jgi:hypothetical protein